MLIEIEPNMAGYQKFQIPSTKLQINLKIQYPMTKKIIEVLS